MYVCMVTRPRRRAVKEACSGREDASIAFLPPSRGIWFNVRQWEKPGGTDVESYLLGPHTVSQHLVHPEQTQPEPPVAKQNPPINSKPAGGYITAPVMRTSHARAPNKASKRKSEVQNKEVQRTPYSPPLPIPYPQNKQSAGKVARGPQVVVVVVVGPRRIL
ncbi:hypothetical protein BDY21DRAFT_350040 [Lineolata rhizophorae]|uniref:Uncharacterized protein n=1 Tax=Lineolata rhizophorae TaxID=578093 RepID=A0A6A6NW40_9PEZI|nr:hypothetical protein BDY21DRAFT_350040 [Lineolata rhizophorae]